MNNRSLKYIFGKSSSCLPAISFHFWSSVLFRFCCGDEKIREERCISVKAVADLRNTTLFLLCFVYPSYIPAQFLSSSAGSTSSEPAFSWWMDFGASQATTLPFILPHRWTCSGFHLLSYLRSSPELFQRC